jgi:retron-type reverse transcriptase
LEKQKKEKLAKDKETRKAINKERLEFQEEKSRYYLRILEGIKEKKRRKKDYYVTNVIKLLFNENFLINCYQNISKNQGSLTKGTDQTTADKININRILKLAKALESGTFKFQPSRRILIPKPGKTAMRPLTIPNFDDRIVQEEIRIILNTIYEGEFEKLNQNFGFRPNKSTIDAIDHFLLNGKGTNFAIEGDIEKAYYTVNIDKLITILENHIKDKKFLTLIEQGLRSGLKFEKIYKNTSLGIPQEAEE